MGNKKLTMALIMSVVRTAAFTDGISIFNARELLHSIIVLGLK